MDNTNNKHGGYHYRTGDDRRTSSIVEMIQEENDPKQRATLIVLNDISSALIASTAAIHDLSSRLTAYAEEFQIHKKAFDEHTSAEDSMISQVKGGWRVFTWFASITQVVIISVLTWALNSGFHMSREINDIKIGLSAYKSKVDTIVETKSK